MSRFKNEYATDGKEDRAAVRAAAGHRCIRCGHPFESGKHGKGEWSPCDEQCTHSGPRRYMVNGQWEKVPTSFASSGILVAGGFEVEAEWRVLTVHHFDGDKSNDA